MALDKQRILNELGSVMNQLKSADCGCMGRLFENTGQASFPQNTTNFNGCRRGCSHGHNYGWNSSGSCGEPYSSITQNTYSPCMGRCNPPKLYADTYNYLTQNLMQPAVKEVYDDLKSLTPANTVMNNPLANKMGFSQNNLEVQGNMGDVPNQSMNGQININNKNPDVFSNNLNQPFNASSLPINETNANQMGQMGGMGPQIMNMLGGNMTNQNTRMEQNNQLSRPTVNDEPQSAHYQVGNTPLSVAMSNKQYTYNNEVNSNQIVNESPVQSNFQPGGNSHNMNGNPAAKQLAAAHHHSHGQYNQGVAKFNEMFPGVMKGMGGDLGFDPMAIAIQMNPANHQQAAMDTMQKMMQNNDFNKVFNQSANTVLQEGAEVSSANSASPNVPQNQVQYNVTQQNPISQSHLPLATNEPIPTNSSTHQMEYQNIGNYNRDVAANQNLYEISNIPTNMQQVYTIGTPNKQTLYQPEQTGQHSVIEQNTSSLIVPTSLPAAYETVNEQQSVQVSNNTPTLVASPAQQMIKEPIFPADTSKYSYIPPKQKYYEYNTLGQPVEMLSAKVYRTPEPALPQTLSPQPIQKLRYSNNPAKYSKVKSTVSKTSIIGNKPIGKTPNQLQQIYNQYKGSQSYTQQNIAAPAINTLTHSEGKIIATQESSHPQMPIEKIGGDTVVKNQVQGEKPFKLDQVIGHIGDVPVRNTPCDGLPHKDVPEHGRKCRNGLQDIVYTSYPSSAAWSFHGASTVPYPTRHRYRK